MRRLAVTMLLVALLAPASALGQGNAFGPLPQASEPTPTPTPVKTTSSQDSIGRSTLLLIALGVAVVFVGLGTAITRDARRNLTDDDRRALERAESGGSSSNLTAKQRNAARAKARQKAKASRAARKRTTRNR